MGLYLCAFKDDEEIEGVDVGSYSDYGRFTDAIVFNLEKGKRGDRFPLITLHPDSDGEWQVSDLDTLESSLREIRFAFEQLPSAPLEEAWQKQVAKILGLKLENLSSCFFDVDGEPLLDRLIDLTSKAKAAGVPILFQ